MSSLFIQIKLKYSVDITMDCMVLHVTEKYTEL